jgi:hypothetical protein
LTIERHSKRGFLARAAGLVTRAAGLVTRAAGLLIAGAKGVPPDSHNDRPGSPGCHLRDPWRIRFGPTWDHVAGRLFPSADNSNSVGGNPDGALSRFDVYTAAIIVQ